MLGRMRLAGGFYPQTRVVVRQFNTFFFLLLICFITPADYRGGINAFVIKWRAVIKFWHLLISTFVTSCAICMEMPFRNHPPPPGARSPRFC